MKCNNKESEMILFADEHRSEGEGRRPREDVSGYSKFPMINSVLDDNRSVSFLN